jgi:hypothetical protein
VDYSIRGPDGKRQAEIIIRCDLEALDYIQAEKQHSVSSTALALWTIFMFGAAQATW